MGCAHGWHGCGHWYGPPYGGGWYGPVDWDEGVEWPRRGRRGRGRRGEGRGEGRGERAGDREMSPGEQATNLEARLQGLREEIDRLEAALADLGGSQP